MYKGKLLNSNIVSTLMTMGHTDQITVCDAGLPIADHVERIDLALIKGTPSFIETLEAIKDHMVVEKVILADEIKENNPEVLEVVLTYFDGVIIEYVTHEMFKTITHDSKAVVRTGECTPYANIILQAGVNFGEV